MKTHFVTLALVILPLAAASVPAPAQKPAPDQEAVHKELRALREGLTDAVLTKDVDKQLGYVSKDVVATWQNGEVARGHQGLKDFLSRDVGGKAFQGYKTPPTPADMTILHGDDTGISYGTSVARYNVLGKDFELTNHWSATLVKEDGRWVIAGYHVSGNILDNPLLNTAKTSLYWVCGVALALGLILGALVTKFLTRARRPAV